MTKNVLLIGCGRLGCAMLQRWLKQSEQYHFTLLEPQLSLELLDLIEPYGRRVVVNPTSAFDVDIAILAVKPQAMQEALSSLRNWLPPSALVVSVAAGIRLATLESRLRAQQPVIRAMPNVAALVGEAASVCIGNHHVSQEHCIAATSLMEAIGKVQWIEDESLMDAVTALSGSGPAYVLLLTQELAHAGEKAGLEPKLAAELARQTVVGAGALLKHSAQSPEELRKQVTSPGGTTEAALKVLMNEKEFTHLLTRAVKAAAERSRQLAS